MARFAADAYVRPPYRKRRAAHLQTLVVCLIALLAALVIFLTVYVYLGVKNAPVPDWDVWNLRIVNQTSPLADDFSVTTIALPGDYLADDETTVRFDARAYDALCAMLNEAKSKGYSPVVTRGYCDADLLAQAIEEAQKRLEQEGCSEEEAYRLALEETGAADTSEYRLGLLVDINGETQSDFSASGLYNWLLNNAHRYGFTLRYPQDRQIETGNEFDPHAFRYVGVPAARMIKRKNMCLETYVEMLQEEAEKSQ